ncbi:DUF4230 domain-containing protein [Leptobacterium flavescens]|uniref:DUF4230 domain-containing protein n=1 Tax=Leptobacterium flavescens TaxID=472055 RepID=A0A6P0ULI9_9FLAO|nr:DUF4230 domain-containing protein [Leptobacterium flavescens]NER12778.1 DUF4230 domain-containing protein [Leptobacterium flavescens]
MENFFGLLLGLLVGALAMYGLFIYFKKKRNRELTEKQSVILLDKIRSVCKLISIEGDFAEIYHYENSKERFLKLISSKKKALIIINAKAHIGFDLSKVKMKADKEQKRIFLSSFPQPEVLSIEPDLKYYDIKNGLFNKFDSRDLSELNREAKEHILEKIPESGLMEAARKEALDAVLLIENIVETIGWKLDYSALKIEDKKIKRIEE